MISPGNRAIQSLMFLFGLAAVIVLLPGFLFGGCLMGRKFPAERAACDRGDVAKCLEAGNLFDGTDYNNSFSYTIFGPDDHAARSYKKACDLGSMEGCQKLGWNVATYELSSLGPETIASLGRACDAKHAISCYYLGYLFARGLGTSRDLSRAATLCEKSCDAGLPNACYVLAALYDLGQGVPRDAKKSQALVARACDGNYDDACDCVRELKSSGSCSWSANALRWVKK